MNPNATNPCATCGAKSTIVCTQCSVTCYCTPYCRDKDILKHRSHCADLLQKLIDRIGRTLREIFYTFSERAFTYSVGSVAKGVDAIMVSQAPSRVGQVLFQFPASLFQGWNMLDRHAILCMRRSEDAIGYLKHFIAHMLEGNVCTQCHQPYLTPYLGVPLSRVEEMSATMRSEPRASLLSCADWRGNRCLLDPGKHHFLRLSASAHGKRWTLDPAGAMYGNNADSLTASNYDQGHARQDTLRASGFGGCEQRLRSHADVHDQSGLRCKVLFIARDCLHDGIEKWMQHSRRTMWEVLRGSDHEYQMQLLSLRTFVHQSMSKIASTQAYQGVMENAIGSQT
ncbi:hypothetical protein BKA63DRAFT_48737 [Paraphoma chrysanthemicola]|nr:hypothetical protein BKA63DRAFT_48737 [Paraphoma chrysanthemicola]